MNKVNSVNLLDKISSSLGSGDRNLLKKAAHNLKGSSGNLGAYRLAEMCGKLEVLAALIAERNKPINRQNA